MAGIELNEIVKLLFGNGPREHSSRSSIRSDEVAVKGSIAKAQEFERRFILPRRTRFHHADGSSEMRKLEPGDKSPGEPYSVCRNSADVGEFGIGIGKPTWANPHALSTLNPLNPLIPLIDMLPLLAISHLTRPRGTPHTRALSRGALL